MSITLFGVGQKVNIIGTLVEIMIMFCELQHYQNLEICCDNLLFCQPFARNLAYCLPFVWILLSMKPYHYPN